MEHLLLLTYDSCRYDVFVAADTPVVDSLGEVVSAQSPANFTYPSHHAMFAGVLPSTVDPLPYYNRFTRQLIGLSGVGAVQVTKGSRLLLDSTWNVVKGLADHGYRTVGAGAMDWFRQDSLTYGFDDFAFTGTDANRQIDFLLEKLPPLPEPGPFYAFVNFGETHAPFGYEGKATKCPVDVRARRMTWPPHEEGPVGQDSEAFAHQVEAVEFLDAQLPRLFAGLPADTVVVLCADHGECFGEDGYWGHGVNHPKILEVPLAIFRLNGAPV